MKKQKLLRNKILLPVVFIGIFGWFQAVGAQCGTNCINPVAGVNYRMCSSLIPICVDIYNQYYSNTQPLVQPMNTSSSQCANSVDSVQFCSDVNSNGVGGTYTQILVEGLATSP